MSKVSASLIRGSVNSYFVLTFAVEFWKKADKGALDSHKKLSIRNAREDNNAFMALNPILIWTKVNENKK
ncbi:MAG: hypothetical protein Roseis2KO_36520 [Roseivirga sp.]